MFGACQQAQGQDVLDNLTIYNRIAARPGIKQIKYSSPTKETRFYVCVYVYITHTHKLGMVLSGLPRGVRKWNQKPRHLLGQANEDVSHCLKRVGDS